MYRIICADEAECRRLIAGLNDVITTYGSASVADINELIGRDVVHEDRFMGWMFTIDPDSVDFLDGGNATQLVLPEPIPIGDREHNPDLDMVNHPPHYQSKNGLEAIQVIEAFTEKLHGIEATDTGNVIKYILRWPDKNGLEDLKKAKWYLEHLINHIEKENDIHE